MPRIDPRRLKALRDHRGWSRNQLFQQARVSVRQLARIESSDAPTEAHEVTVSRLAKAFAVSAELLGEPLASDEHASAARHAPIVAPDRLKALRKQRRWSQQELANKAGISRRQVARIESSEKPLPVKPKTLRGLSAALKVKPADLSRETPNVDVPMPEAGSVSVGISVDPQTRLAFDLVQRRYGPAMRDIIHLAPLMFVLLAEGSLAWRRERLAEVDRAMQALRNAAEADSQLYFAKHMIDVEWGADAERESIKRADLLGDVVRDDDWSRQLFAEDDLFAVTPFADYLLKLEEALNLPGVVRFETPELMLTEPWGAEPYVVCDDELERLAGGSRRARWTLEYGAVRISEIPGELMPNEPDKQKEKRIAWLEERLSGDLRAEFERREAWLSAAVRRIRLKPSTSSAPEGDAP